MWCAARRRTCGRRSTLGSTGGSTSSQPRRSTSSSARNDARPRYHARPLRHWDSGYASGWHPRAPSSPILTLAMVAPNAPQNSAVVRVGLGVSLFILLTLLAIVGFLFWWRIRFRGLAPAAGALARVARLGSWAGAPPSRAQTPNEYAEQVAMVVPDQQATIQQLTDLYSRERWSGEIDLDAIDQAPRLYEGFAARSRRSSSAIAFRA